MTEIRSCFKALLEWYHKNKRPLPWRQDSFGPPDPYRVWLVEIMSQQTLVTTVIPYFLTFIKQWPSVDTLARASIDDVLTAWAGLGYYQRAKTLHKSANMVVSHYQGRFPENFSELLALPGVGNYTAAAIASIAFHQPYLAIDGNLRRVLSRLGGISSSPEKLEAKLKERFETHLNGFERPGDINQALMDVSALFCRPRKPNCEACPLRSNCMAFKTNTTDELPIKVAKKTPAHRFGTAFVIRHNQHVLMRKRPPGLLGGLWETPTTDWCTKDESPAGQTMAVACLTEIDKTCQKLNPHDRQLIQGLNWHDLGTVRHVFTHFRLTLSVVAAEVHSRPMLSDSFIWLDPCGKEKRGVSKLMLKVLQCEQENYKKLALERFAVR